MIQWKQSMRHGPGRRTGVLRLHRFPVSMAKAKVTRLGQTEQPLNWKRAFVSGVLGASLMMGFIDIFFMLGYTPFSYEEYMGALLRGTIYGQQNWAIGLLVNWFIGGLFGFVYAFAFEFVYKRADTRIGTKLGLGHAILAACAFFPFFTILHQELGTGLYPDFGFFGVGLGAPTPILLLMGTLLFGSTMGLFYGPVRADRIRLREWEPGEWGLPGDPEVITDGEDPRVSELVYPKGA
jgi:hypothetical protein